VSSIQIPDGVITIGNVDTFNKLVHNFRDHLIVTTFSNAHCGACKAFNPIFERVQREMHDAKVLFTKVDSDQLPEVVEQFQVMGTPTTLFIYRQKLKKRRVGLIPKPELTGMIQSILQEIAAD
jgi:thiol-disulfide isomerase/thioredoxin